MLIAKHKDKLDSCFYLGLLLLRGVDDGRAADLGQLAALTVKGPAADLVSNHVFDEEDAAVEAKRQPVKELDVLQHVVVGVAAEMWRSSLMIYLFRSLRLLSSATLSEHSEGEKNDFICDDGNTQRKHLSPGVGVLVIASVVQQFHHRLTGKKHSLNMRCALLILENFKKFKLDFYDNDNRICFGCGRCLPW